MKKIFILLVTLIAITVCRCYASTNAEAMLQYNQGIDLYKIGQYDDAITCFRTAIRLDPNYIDAYYNLGSVLEYLQQYDAALAVFKQIIVRKPEDYDSVYKAAWLSHQLGQDQKAKTYLSIIPQDSSRAQEAYALSSQLNLAVQPKESSPVIKPSKVSQSSGIYEDISAPTGITSDDEGNVYVAEFTTNTIVKITPDGKKMIYLKDAKIDGPIGLAFDKSKNMYIANYNKNNILKVSSLGEISVLIGNIKKPYCLYIDGKVLFISSQGSSSVLRYKLPN